MQNCTFAETRLSAKALNWVMQGVDLGAVQIALHLSTNSAMFYQLLHGKSSSRMADSTSRTISYGQGLVLRLNALSLDWQN